MFPLPGCGSHRGAPGHQRQEPAVHRVRHRQQRQDPRQRALRRRGGRMVKGHEQPAGFPRKLRSKFTLPNFAKFHILML